MQDILSQMTSLKRPRLLIRAARAGADEYSRESHLGRHFGYGRLPRSGPALIRLMETEALLNAQRERGEAGYSLVKHVDVLIAMMGEARLLKASRPQPVQS